MFLQKSQDNTANTKTFKFVCIFILLQPVFDLLSFLYIRNYIPIAISTYAKPLIAGIIMLFLFFTNKKYLLKGIGIFATFGLLLVPHVLLLFNLNTKISVIFHETRFMLNLVYILINFINIYILYNENQDKEGFSKTLKKVLLITFSIYIFLYFLSILTGTSGKTYEYSDPLKLGYKGWLDSGQIFGHSLCILLPLLMHLLFNNKLKNKALNILLRLSIALPLLVLCLIGTKVTYFIAIVVVIGSFVLNLIFSLKDKSFKKLFDSAICLICAGTIILVYPILPVKTNIDINNSVLSEKPSDELIDEITSAENDKLEFFDENSSKDTSELEKYLGYEQKAYEKLKILHKQGIVHTSDTRKQQLYFNLEKFKVADLKYKIFGLGYLNQPSTLSIERDVFAILFNFGILGFIIFLLYPMLLWLKSTIVILKNLKRVKLQTLLLYEGFSMFFFISAFAGYTFIYTNFSIYLIILLFLLRHDINILKNSKIKEPS